jgi:hypothetical protein
MADDRFDVLTRKLASTQSRAGMLRSLAALGAGAALFPASALGARKHNPFAATCIGKGHVCNPKGGTKRCHKLRCAPVACKAPCKHPVHRCA